MKDQSFLKRISIVLFVIMLVMFIVHVQILVHFNRQVITVHGNDRSGSSYMEINDRENSTSSWLKRDFPLTEESTVDLIGQTIDETLYNNSGIRPGTARWKFTRMREATGKRFSG